MAQPNATDEVSSWDPHRVTMVTEQFVRLRDLSGFQKHHKVPQRAGSGADAFVAEVATEEITLEIEDVFRSLKAAFAFKRRDTQVANIGDGTATITTPYFNYSVRVTANPANPAQAIWRRMVDTISKPEQIRSQSFTQVFGTRFNTIEFSPPGDIDLETLIDRIEDMEDERITLDYDPEVTYCRLKIEGLAAEITITADTLGIVHQGPVPPGKLLHSFLAIQEALFSASEVRRISFDRHD